MRLSRIRPSSIVVITEPSHNCMLLLQILVGRNTEMEITRCAYGFQGHRKSGRTQQLFTNVDEFLAHGPSDHHEPEAKAEETRQGKSGSDNGGGPWRESGYHRVPASVSQSAMELFDEELSQREKYLRQDRR